MRVVNDWVEVTVDVTVDVIVAVIVVVEVLMLVRVVVEVEDVDVVEVEVVEVEEVTGLPFCTIASAISSYASARLREKATERPDLAELAIS